MSGKAPVFITGNNAKIKVNGVTLAYATDFSVEVTIQHQQAKVLGMYEADTLEPISYNITGSFTIIRYIEGAKKRLESNGFSIPHGLSNLGNGIGSMGPNTLLSKMKSVIDGSGRLQEALDPSKLSIATGFDIELYQKIPDYKPNTIVRNTFGPVVRDDNGNSIDEKFRSTNDNNVSGILRLRDCHINNMKTSINKRGLLMQSFSFIANYIDEDSYISNSSDNGQRIG